MPSPIQTDLLDGMIARLEEANTKAYQQQARANKEPSRSGEDDATHHRSDQRAHVVASERRSSPARKLFFALIGLVMVASAGIAAFAWEPSYGDVARLFIVRWTNTWDVHTASQAQTKPQDGALASPISPIIEQRLQRMADDLVEVEQRIEQLRANQDQIIRSQAEVAEQLKTSQEQMIRDNAKVIELGGAVAQLAHQNAAVAQQLKASQEQLVEVASSLAANSSTRKPSRSKPVSIVSSLQKRAQAQSSSRQP